jgi:hypothetical protein
MQGGMRGLKRLEVAQAKLALEIIQRIIVSLNVLAAKLEDLQTSVSFRLSDGTAATR